MGKKQTGGVGRRSEVPPPQFRPSMSTSMDAARVALRSLRSSLEQSGTQGRDVLFEGREHLRDAMRMLAADQGVHLVPLAETLSFYVEQLLRGEGGSGEAALEGLLRLTDALLELTNHGSGSHRNPLALNYLMGQDSAVLTRDDPAYLRAGPARTPTDTGMLALGHPGSRSAPPKFDPAKVGLLLSGYDRMSNTSLGQVLLRQGAIDAPELDRALALQQMGSLKLGEVLIAVELVGMETLNNALERQRMETRTPLREHAAPQPVVPETPLRKTGS